MRTIKWSYDMLRTLREMYPHDTNTRIAAAIGVGTRCVVAKAAELGLEKERDIRRKEAERILMEKLPHSFPVRTVTPDRIESPHRQTHGRTFGTENAMPMMPHGSFPPDARK